MIQKRIENDYFEWMYDIVCENRFDDEDSFRKLLTHLHDIEFTYSIPSDADRASDGLDLRYRYAYEHHIMENIEDYISGPCSVLEMMIALALRCEETIMDNTNYGNRTSQWFWRMIVNLGLGYMLDSRYDEFHVESVIATLLNRDYEPNGQGGLFLIRHCDYDLRYVSIWDQMLWMCNNTR